MTEDIITNEKHWFTPLYPTDSQIDHLKDLEQRSKNDK